MRRLLLVALVVLLPACGSSGAPKATTTPAEKPTVLAAASLTEAFTELGGATFSFAGSQALVTQIQQGAPADVFASADEAHMKTLVDAGLVETPRTFARNRLEIAVAPGNPKHITGLADLTHVTVVLADRSVPAGTYATQALAKAGVTVQPRSFELDVKSALTKVVSGDADATIVYETDVRAAGNKVTGVVIPDAENVVATYPIAVLKHAPHHAAAEAFVDLVLGATGRQVLQRRGFLAP
jgi:molybdate transport system substrate-binding protein